MLHWTLSAQPHPSRLDPIFLSFTCHRMPKPRVEAEGPHTEVTSVSVSAALKGQILGKMEGWQGLEG